MYQTLLTMGKTYAATDNQKFPCVSLAYPRPGRFMNYYDTDRLRFYNREYYEPQPPLRFPTVNGENPMLEPRENRLPVKGYCDDPNSLACRARPLGGDVGEEGFRPKKPEDQKNLLPVLDSRFNLREICKQCILLEDHLTHDSKRCYDCCVKHFLALEGLSEEAVTLDKEKNHDDLRAMPDQIREIQKLWYKNPDKNAHEASQRLRELRKKFMQHVFPVPFTTPSCSGGGCRIAAVKTEPGSQPGVSPVNHHASYQIREDKASGYASPADRHERPAHDRSRDGGRSAPDRGHGAGGRRLPA